MTTVAISLGMRTWVHGGKTMTPVSVEAGMTNTDNPCYLLVVYVMSSAIITVDRYWRTLAEL